MRRSSPYRVSLAARAPLDRAPHDTDRIGGAVHLRAYGADAKPPEKSYGSVGSPPCVRSGRKGGVLRTPPRRLTSVRTERTSPPARRASCRPAHLRAYGADWTRNGARSVSAGSPPCVRSGLCPACAEERLGRLTSVRTERTMPPRTDELRGAAHLRAYGADMTDQPDNFMPLGSPPCVRSGRRDQPGAGPHRRLTSVRTERTGLLPAGPGGGPAHLRAYGADGVPAARRRDPPGSPPCVRSGRVRFADIRALDRLTSVRTERPLPELQR